MKRVIIIGGGAAGMLAAGAAAERGASVVLLERNDKLGKKLYITGKGRCNMTNAVMPDELIENVPGNASFLYSAFYGFGAFETITLFEQLGLRTKTERGNRVFPASDKASDVIKALAHYAARGGVEVRLRSVVQEISLQNGTVTGVVANGEFLAADAVIVATGGLSYPMTGSTGDGYRFARTAGHHVSKLRPSLVPLKTKEQWVPSLQGLSLKNVELTVRNGKKKLFDGFGEMLFTHEGVSGPLVLSASRYVLDVLRDGCTLHIDLKPALSDKELDARLLRDFAAAINKDFRNCLDALLPQKLIPVIVGLSGIDPMKKAHDIKKEERLCLGALIKNLRMTIVGTAGFDEAVITAGGVAVDEINPSTMESKIVKGLYFAGEVIDVDAYTGGFNLQIAFSTGRAAGIGAAGGEDEII